MATYRIISLKHKGGYAVDKKILGIFWYRVFGHGIFNWSIEEAESYIKDTLAREKMEKENAKDTVVKHY